MTERTVNNKKSNKMSPRTKEQFEAIRQSSKSKIMEVAFTLFAENGYLKTSIASIAREAGVSKGLLYNYFESKEALLLELVRIVSSKIIQHFPYLENIPNEPPAVLLERFIRDTIHFLHGETGLWRKTYAVILQQEVRTIIEPVMNEFTQPYMSILYKLFEYLGVKNPVVMGNLFNVHFDGIAIGYTTDGAFGTEEELIESLLELYIPKELRNQ